WVAVGGRGTLLGPVFGAALVNGAKSFFTQAFPEYWLFFLGALFILVTLFLPQGVAGLVKKPRKQAPRPHEGRLRVVPHRLSDESRARASASRTASSSPWTGS